MRQESIFELNKLADEYELLAKQYRAVANDMMRLEPKLGKPKLGRPKKEKRGSWSKGYKYNGTHWKQIAAAKKKGEK